MNRTNEPYVLSVLGDDDCLSLLALHALGRENFHDHRDLKESGEQIVKNCGRLPLAIKTIAGLLFHIPQERRQWEDVLNNKKWAEKSEGILPALRLSYYHLPYHLKQCFAYCSIIPKDYIFNRNDLVLLWMAEGLLQQPAGNSMQMEDFGHDCFQELLSRSFFQLTRWDESEFIMHDLINDLAVYVAGERCFRMDDKWDDKNENYKISERTRYLSFICQKDEVSKKFNVFNTARLSRTLLPLPPYMFRTYETFNISDAVLALTLSQLQSLRVLNLSRYRIVELPNTIGALKHLRYLNLSYTTIQQLPQFVGSLYNLQTLSLNGCFFLRELPSSIGCLTNLRHLDLENTSNLIKMPSGIGKLTSLRTLSKIIVGKDTGSCSLKDLKDLKHLHGTLLSIEELQNVTDYQDAVAADLRSREHLKYVKLQWRFKDSDGSSRDKLMENKVLEILQPHCNLKALHIEGYGGVRFPSWVGGQSMSNVVKIHFRECSEITHLPPLGELPLLKDLAIEGLGSITTVGDEFYGGHAEEIAFPPVASKGLFPRLRDLRIDYCQELGNSTTTLELPCLRLLYLRQCIAFLLERLINLTSLRKMVLDGVVGLSCLPEQFVNSLVSLEEADFWRCGQLGSLWRDNETSLKNPFNHLSMLCVSGCHNLISLLEDGEQGLPRNLKNLMLEECAKLEKLPNRLHGLASLEYIEISDCPSLVFDTSDQLPKSVKALELVNCTKSVLSNWGFHRLTSLQSLIIWGFEEVVSFEQVVGDSNSTSYFFPPSLTSLSVRSFPNLESLSNSLQNLTSLRELRILDCPKLESLAGADDDEASLQIISSLHVLSFGGGSSEVLRKRCKEEGKYWPTIQHIPLLYINMN